MIALRFNSRIRQSVYLLPIFCCDTDSDITSFTVSNNFQAACVGTSVHMALGHSLYFRSVCVVGDVYLYF